MFMYNPDLSLKNQFRFPIFVCMDDKRGRLTGMPPGHYRSTARWFVFVESIFFFLTRPFSSRFLIGRFLPDAAQSHCLSALGGKASGRAFGRLLSNADRYRSLLKIADYLDTIPTIIDDCEKRIPPLFAPRRFPPNPCNYSVFVIRWVTRKLQLGSNRSGFKSQGLRPRAPWPAFHLRRLFNGHNKHVATVGVPPDYGINYSYNLTNIVYRHSVKRFYMGSWQVFWLSALRRLSIQSANANWEHSISLRRGLQLEFCFLVGCNDTKIQIFVLGIWNFLT